MSTTPGQERTDQTPRVERSSQTAGAKNPSQAAGAKKIWTVLDLLRFTTEHFARNDIETPRLDAECLLAFALGTDRMQLYLDFDKPVLLAERDRFRALVRSRARERVPVAYLTGVREFWSLALHVTPDVLVPRPETETLVAVALECFPEPEAEIRVLDLGTGSGAIALAIASERPKARIIASDESAPALRIAAGNAERLGLAECVRFVQGDLFAPVSGERFELIVSNPPYLALREAGDLAPELSHEPEQALFAGPAGLELLTRLVAQAPTFLEPGGMLLLEIAPDQAEAVQAACGARGLITPTVHPDLGGQPRAVSVRMPAGSGEG